MKQSIKDIIMNGISKWGRNGVEFSLMSSSGLNVDGLEIRQQ